MGLFERIRRRGDDSPEAAPAEGDPTTSWAPPAEDAGTAGSWVPDGVGSVRADEATAAHEATPGAGAPSGPAASDDPAATQAVPPTSSEAPTTVQPAAAGLWHDAQPGAPADGTIPAGAEPADPLRATTPSFLDRGRLRRRLRYLRRVRELGFRDLGGLVFDQHRFGVRRQDLIDGKLQALLAVDRELRALERALGDRREFIDLREPGIAACPRCSALHGSDAKFCPSCGLRLGGPLAFAEVAEGPQVVDPDAGVVQPPPPPPPEPEMAEPLEQPTQVLVVPTSPPAPEQPTERLAAVDPAAGDAAAEGDAAGDAVTASLGDTLPASEHGRTSGETSGSGDDAGRAAAPASGTAEVTPAGPDVPGGDSADPLPEDDRADAHREA